MEQTVKVRALLPNGKASVAHVRQSACSGDCHKCSGCGAAEETLILTAENPIGAVVGDVVVMESDTAPVLKAATVLYVIPILLFFIGYGVGSILGRAALTGIAGFFLGVLFTIIYDRKIESKNKTVYTITRLKNQ